ncbi:hypothetical protein ACE1TF_11990 [Geomicrobium sp. JSM 1781026]|uniref:hypothetical protein n=1 Tax=Geomicrobium sp. JSM 1781026 TaxID=3344580 RepID=UPI0035BF1B09
MSQEPVPKKVPYEQFKESNDQLQEYRKTFEELGIDNADHLRLMVEELRKQPEKSDLELAKERELQLVKESREMAGQLLDERKKLEQLTIKNAFVYKALATGFKYATDAAELADLSDAYIDDDGLVQGIDEAVTKIKEEKPFLLKSAKKTARSIG